MISKPGTLARCVASGLTAAAVVAGGAIVASPAFAVTPLPTITSVFVAGSSTNKVVTSGSTIVITGTGFTGMTDNAAVSGCSSNAPVAYPTTNSGCSQVRFLGVGATSTSNFTVATRYTVVSDTTIYATVPTISATDGASGGPVAGTGSVKVQVLNTMGGGTSSLLSASTASELFYRRPLTATIAATNANPVGGGVLTVAVTGGIANLTTTTFPLEKITAYVYSTVGTGSNAPPQVASATVAFKDTTNVSVTLPPNSPDGSPFGLMLVHDGIPGTADTTHLTYPAVINDISTCSVDLTSTLPSTLPACTGPANTPGSGTADVKVTGKGLTGVTVWDWDGSLTTSSSVGVEYTCTVISDTLAYCHLVIHTLPSPPVVSVSFTTVDPDSGGPLTAPALAPTSGGILIYSSLV
ncbi:hypothetical protein [Actinoplanes subtropicus]|uniref:hypothetical protein n=1 Tax=Actinoplanes subtropicus TaxID=543632 RepID=UPI0012FB8D40|nr:hypothetical protein [Actinoplanes subtropicus]